jgi:hypothetical protein
LKFKLIQLKSQNNFFDFRPTQLYYLYLRRACENLRDSPKNAADRPAQNMAGKPAKQARHRARRVNIVVSSGAVSFSERSLMET